MTNASIKEQLQSLGLSTVKDENPKFEKKKPHFVKQSKPLKTERPNPPPKSSQPQQPPKYVKPKPQKPAWLEQAQYGVELLKAHFPACFKDIKEIQPLKKGIKQDLVKHLSTQEAIVISDKACMVNSLAYYVNSPAYHKRVVEGAVRIDLDGLPAGVVSAEEARYSIDCREAKLQKKKVNTAVTPQTTKEG